MPKEALILTPAMIQKYVTHLKEQEHSAATIQKYTHDINTLREHLNGAPVTKAALIDWKQQLIAHHASSSVKFCTDRRQWLFALAGAAGTGRPTAENTKSALSG